MIENLHPTKLIKSTTLRLTCTYLLIIMLMSLIFSTVLYQTSVNQLRRRPPSVRDFGTGSRLEEVQERRLNELDNFLNKRLRESEGLLFIRLVWLNLFVGLIGAGVSYLLARKTLKPIEEVLELQTRFVSDASHELRTPLTTLQTINEVALRQPKLSVSEAREIITQNVEEVIKLRNLSNNLLELLQHSSRKPKLSKLPIVSVVDEAIGQTKTAASEKNITIQNSVSETEVLSDKSMLAQILVILLDNAIKYSQEKSTVKISTKTKSKHLYLDVEDKGVGIEAKDLPHIFDRFYRVDLARTKNDTKGYGLGLSIAKKLSEQIDATISVKSTITKGSIFTIKIPMG